MNIRTITATYTRKYNMGNYESLELSTMLVGDLDLNDDPIEAQQELFMRCVSAVHDTALELGAVKATPPVNVQPMFMGKPVKTDLIPEHIREFNLDDYEGDCSQRRDGDVNGFGFDLDSDPF